MADGLTRVESFPFDSRADGYDVDGYPVYDRAVGASMLRSTFEKFFTDGVFGTPADALQIEKAESGLAVTIRPGTFIIDGAMGGIPSTSDPMKITLERETVNGNIAYAIMLRIDNNDDTRSLYFRVAKGEAAASPVPPEPDRTSPNVYEYRLGYVVLPNGAKDMSSATVTNEKGTLMCPYAAPFEEIDLSEVVSDAQKQADAALDQYLEYVEEYYDLVLSAVDGTTAAHLQEQIDELKSSGGIAEAIDPNYLAYQDPDGDLVNKVGIVANAVGTRELKDAAVTEGKLADLSVTDMKLSYKIQDLLGIMTTEGWDYQKYLSYMNSLPSTAEKEAFVNKYVTSSTFQSWQLQNEVAFVNAAPASTQLKLARYIQWGTLDAETMFTTIKQLPAVAQPSVVGNTWNVNCGSYGVNKFKVIGINHDNMVSGGKALITMEATKPFILMEGVTSRSQYFGEYNQWPLSSTLEDLYSKIEETYKSRIVQVHKQKVVQGTDYNYSVKSYPVHAFTLSELEYAGSNTYGLPGWTESRYQYYAEGGSYVHEKNTTSDTGYMMLMRSPGIGGSQTYYPVMSFANYYGSPRLESGIQADANQTHCPAFCLNF